MSLVSDEVFQMENRLCFKPSKCKVMEMNCCEENSNFTLNSVKLDVVKEKKYLGTIVANNGRESDIEKRISETQGVANEFRG